MKYLYMKETGDDETIVLELRTGSEEEIREILRDYGYISDDEHTAIRVLEECFVLEKTQDIELITQHKETPYVETIQKIKTETKTYLTIKESQK